MPRPTEIQNIIEEAVAEVFDAALPKLRSEIVRRAVEVVGVDGARAGLFSQRPAQCHIRCHP